MPTIESFIHLCFLVGLPIMGIVAVVMAIQTFTLGTQAHQEACKEKVKASTNPDTSTHEAYYLGFFHPYPNAGGGGERVLWTMIKAIQDKYPFIVCVIYSGDSLSRDSLLRNVQAKFGLTIRADTIYIVELSGRWWVDYKFPRLTLLMQSLGSVALASQAIHRFCPDVFVETVGFAFTYPLVRLLSARIPIVAYTHYPAISSDMQTMVSSREAGFNNEAIAKSAWMSALKSVYYKAFALVYSFAGSFASTIMTNSTWTQNHIVKLFGNPKMTKVVYPPCDTQALADFALAPRQPLIVSLAQFRPEKNHKLQIEAFAHLLQIRPDFVMPKTESPMDSECLLKKCRDSLAYPMLVMIGGARNIEDEARAEELRQMAKRLGVDRQVLVIVNAPWSRILEWLQLAKVGMHTMRDEHFGINIVEMMAAGLLTIAHDSAGPKLDIIAPAIRSAQDVPTDKEVEEFNAGLDKGMGVLQMGFPVGFVATTAEEFAESMSLALSADEGLVGAVQRAARATASTKFSEDAFRDAFYKRFSPVIRWLDNQRSPNDDE
ncbi:asparagine-linked glycosylation protein [Coemansia pectinata]|uniref:GDP-Man:Man(3)GlcNAc(2)-PP-Dol alpha-1,2-mannosyltransferase n=1 Tax=Coemansia pectinata TaxID=1052879 RepID=A0A9W8LBY9_9FUNG|nr:asparagine-linked glycosylation protein [Coemansia pectinata]